MVTYATKRKCIVTGMVKQLCQRQAKYNENVRIRVDITPLIERGIYGSIFTQVEWDYGVGSVSFFLILFPTDSIC